MTLVYMNVTCTLQDLSFYLIDPLTTGFRIHNCAFIRSLTSCVACRKQEHLFKLAKCQLLSSCVLFRLFVTHLLTLIFELLAAQFRLILPRPFTLR